MRVSFEPKMNGLEDGIARHYIREHLLHFHINPLAGICIYVGITFKGRAKKGVGLP